MSESSNPEKSRVTRREQLAERLRHRIRRGEWPVGTPIPPTRVLAQQSHVSSITVQSVLGELEAQGLIERMPRRGTIVRARIPQNGGDRQVAIISYGDVSEGPGPADFAWRIVHAAQDQLVEDQFHPLVFQANHAVADPAADVLKRLEGFGSTLNGVIHFDHPTLAPLAGTLGRWGVPWVVVNAPSQHAIHNYVAADNLMGCRLVGQALARMGLHRVLVLVANGAGNSQTEMEKVTGLIQGFIEAGVSISGIEIQAGRGQPEAVALAALQRRERPDVVFCYADTIAFAVIRACAKLGLSIPEDMRLVSSGGLGLAEIAQPPLTALTQPAEQIGAQAAQMLSDMVARHSTRIDRRRVPGHLVIRESCPIPEDVCQALREQYPQIRITDATGAAVDSTHTS